MTTLAGGPNCQGVSKIEQRPQLLSKAAQACNPSQGDHPPPTGGRGACLRMGTQRPQEDFPMGKSIVPAGCAAESRMMNPASGTDEQKSAPPSSCFKLNDTFYRKTRPDLARSGRVLDCRDGQWDALSGCLTAQSKRSPLILSIRSITGTPKGHRCSQFPQAIQSSALALRAW